MQPRKLGTSGLSVGAIGLGCMGMSHGYGSGDDAESIATIHRALDRGVTLLDTAEVYGPYRNEELVGKALRGRRAGVVIATKFGFRIKDGKTDGTDGTPQNAKKVAHESLKRLGVEAIDLYYLHRKDPAVPIEETVGAMKDLVQAGLVRYLGLSEVGSDTLKRAHRVHPIAALQSEYSLWERGIEANILPTLRQLGIGLVPFSPLGRGFLTGTFKGVEQLSSDDIRRNLPRFDAANAAANDGLLVAGRDIAARHGITAAQVALAWVLAQGDDVVPIPGTRRRTYLDQNIDALEVRLTEQDLSQLDSLAARVSGERYSGQMARLVER
ncbi:MAG TPA: aldo/keto reductase [Steroidobacteraceae bacterium]|nr:aldo/keto reductase [Steroidobacteraceae bacterium]